MGCKFKLMPLCRYLLGLTHTHPGGGGVGRDPMYLRPYHRKSKVLKPYAGACAIDMPTDTAPDRQEIAQASTTYYSELQERTVVPHSNLV